MTITLRKNILPFNPGRVGFGPGPAATEARFFQRANQKIARRRLHDALSQIEVGPIFDNTVEDFNKALEHCFKQKINKNDSDIVSTMAKVELLTLKNGDLFFHIFFFNTY